MSEEQGAQTEPAEEATEEPKEPPSVSDDLKAAMAEQAEPEESEEQDEAEEPEPEVEATEEQEDAPQSEEAEAPEEKEELKAPEHWSAEHKELFEKQPEETKEFLLERHKAMEGDYTRKMQEVAPVKKVLDHYQPTFESLGVTPEQAVATLLKYDEILRYGSPEQKQAMIQKVAQDYGIASEEDEGFDDDIDKKIQQSLQPLQQSIQSIVQNNQQSTLRQKQAEIDNFKNAKTEAGELAHPFFDEVEQDMIALAQAERAAGREPAIGDLYEKAIWSNESTRQKLIAAQKGAAQEERARKESTKAKKKASSSVTGSSAARSAADEDLSKLSIREQLEKALGEQQNSRI